jgi:hypothetical protein
LVVERLNAGGANVPRGEPTRARGLSGVHTLLTAHPDSLLLANYALVKRVVVDMARTCAANGVSFVVMSVPLVYEGDVVAELRAVDPTFDPDFFESDLAALADTTGFAVVPLTDAFSAVHAETGQRLHWAHWNYLGHRLVGKVLARALAAPHRAGAGGDNQ